MIKLKKTVVLGWQAAIRGMRNPMNSWDKSDSVFIPSQYCDDETTWALSQVCGGKAPVIKENDRSLMQKLAAAGPDHAKFLRMINVTVDITAPLYWWKEFDTYKVGTVANSCSTMHKIHAKEFTLNDFSHEKLRVAAVNILKQTIKALNAEREAFIGNGLPELKGDKECWYSMIQLLPSSYNQLRTVQLNYQVLKNIYPSRKDHKLDEWRDFCRWIEGLPHSWLITGQEAKEDKT